MTRHTPKPRPSTWPMVEEVARLRDTGLTIQEIADEMNLGTSTVHTKLRQARDAGLVKEVP
ncbi:MAG: winged helix-turn-helix transcriptional regulator [Acidimicrobiia bacterium]|nr:winged helix-turn-helix transcriptional regulator [Acidimicrobiia bacterium]